MMPDLKSAQIDKIQRFLHQLDVQIRTYLNVSAHGHEPVEENRADGNGLHLINMLKKTGRVPCDEYDRTYQAGGNLKCSFVLCSGAACINRG